jgi:hypothetical protein
MKEPYAEGIATHGGPELCGRGREAAPEALVGGSAGRLLSRESENTPGAEVFTSHRRRNLTGREGEAREDPARSIEPEHARTHHTREPGGPVAALARRWWARAAARSPRTHCADERTREV